VPLKFDFVPYRIADGWQHVRGEVAICGAMVLIVEALIYVLFGLG
jgi:hypothetical protein